MKTPELEAGMEMKIEIKFVVDICCENRIILTELVKFNEVHQEYFCRYLTIIIILVYITSENVFTSRLFNTELFGFYQ